MSPAVYQWAARHGVTLQALAELQAIFGMHGGHELPAEVKGTSEAAAVHAHLTDEQRRAAIAASEKPVAIIIDHVNNVIRHGLPDARREWSLDRRERRSGKKSDAIPMRVCLNADCVQPYERVFKGYTE